MKLHHNKMATAPLHKLNEIFIINSLEIVEFLKNHDMAPLFSFLLNWNWVNSNYRSKFEGQ